MTAAAHLNGARWALGAFSLPEMLVVISVIAILGAIAVPMYSGIMRSSQVEIAKRNLNLLNGAVSAYRQINQELTNAAGNEAAVITALKTRDTNLPGSPFIETNRRIVVTSSTNLYRARWNGVSFEFRDTGSSGQGVDLMAFAGRTN
jgi:prepilin-type N-terminal cleavage/methylation domain-containing protein